MILLILLPSNAKFISKHVYATVFWMVSKEMEAPKSLDTIAMAPFPYRAPPNALHVTQWHSLKGFILIFFTKVVNHQLEFRLYR